MVFRDGFADAVDLCSTINATLCEDGTNFGLTEAAYVLSSAGTLWGKRVDGMVRTAQRTLDCLTDLDKGKKTKTSAGEDEKKEKIRKRSGHPLAMTLPDNVKGRWNFIAQRETQANQSIKAPSEVIPCTGSEFPRLTEEAYFLQAQPSSLPLLNCERIRPYIDDRENKTLDWADFRVNTLKINRDGFYPLTENGKRIFEGDVERDGGYDSGPEEVVEERNGGDIGQVTPYSYSSSYSNSSTLFRCFRYSNFYCRKRTNWIFEFGI